MTAAQLLCPIQLVSFRCITFEHTERGAVLPNKFLVFAVGAYVKLCVEASTKSVGRVRFQIGIDKGGL